MKFLRKTLSNGLIVIVHEDHTTPLAACTIVYRVGSRDENPESTGLAHLTEHLMFTGSAAAPDFDVELQKAGAINNAYTSQDLTNYYIVLPAQNIETALWLESDRMLNLLLFQNSLNVQKQVVIEEFKETCLNVPYGDLLLQLNDESYKNHPYQWLPIGKKIEHIERVDLDVVKNFRKKFYCPANAILVVAGNVDTDNIFELASKWFEDIPAGKINPHFYPQELPNLYDRMRIVNKNVPNDMLYKSWLMCERTSSDYYAYDLLSDILGTGKSSYLYKKLVLKERIFTDISASISGTHHCGLFMIGGRPAEGISIEKADEELSKYLKTLYFDSSISYDLQKVKNNAESIILEKNLKVEDRANNLAVGEFYNRAEDILDETSNYFKVSEKDIKHLIEYLFRNSYSNTLYYKAGVGQHD